MTPATLTLARIRELRAHLSPDGQHVPTRWDDVPMSRGFLTPMEVYAALAAAETLARLEAWLEVRKENAGGWASVELVRSNLGFRLQTADRYAPAPTLLAALTQALDQAERKEPQT